MNFINNKFIYASLDQVKKAEYQVNFQFSSTTSNLFLSSWDVVCHNAPLTCFFVVLSDKICGILLRQQV